MSRSILLGTALIVIFLFFATRGGLTATPKFWHDEAVPFEIARNIAEFGKADLAIAPHVFWEKSYMTHATGFPLTFPLAGVFKIFGAGVAQSRIFMIVWMLAALTALFFVMRAFFNARTAFFSVLLVATFSSFYANGRTGTGEIPGFFFLIIALYFLYQKEWYGWGGFFAALAAVTKPSMYLLVLPVIVLELLISANKKVPNIFTGLRARAGMVSRNSGTSEGEPLSTHAGRARKVKMFGTFLISIFLGALPIILFWIWLINPAPFSIPSWQGMIAFYQNAFNAPSLLSQFFASASRPTVILGLLTHSTLIYFGALLAIIIFTWWRNFFNAAQSFESAQDKNRLVNFLLLYGAFSFFYFLRSPGWFRYLLGTELLILALLPAALEKAAESIFTLNYEMSKMARMACFSFFVGLPVTNPDRSRGRNGDKEKSKNIPSSHAFRNSKKTLSAFLLIGIALLQSAQYLLDAEIPFGTKSIEIAQFINEEILASDPTATIGFVDYAPVAALIPADRKYQRVAVGGYDTFVGQHPLSFSPEELPTYMLALKKNDPYQETLRRFYKPFTAAPYDAAIYKKINTPDTLFSIDQSH